MTGMRAQRGAAHAGVATGEPGMLTPAGASPADGGQAAAGPAGASASAAANAQAGSAQAGSAQAGTAQAGTAQAGTAQAGNGGAGPGGQRQAYGPGWLRWGWRQLTSMRTALILLFLLALGSVPGSVLPQEGLDPTAVQHYYTAHPGIAPLLGRLGLFDVFGAPWFAAIYLLLFLSLAGCVIPRTFRLAGSARQRPPRAPRNLSRLPLTARYETSLEPGAALSTASRLLGGKRFRLHTGDGWVSAEKGYLREAGNLLFHLALLALLGAIALGGMFGYKANRLLVVGDTFANTISDLDVFHPGRLVSGADLQPFTITLSKYKASYIPSGPQRGQPANFDALIHYLAHPGAPSRSYHLRINHPLVVDGVRVFMIGHGYAPVFRVTDGTGHVRFNGPVPFIAAETSGLTSEGVIKVPDAQPQQLGFAGVFLPTAVDVGGKLSSAFPAPVNPAVSLVSYAGNLGMDSGQPQSVYDLSTTHMHRLAVAPRPLAPGQSMKLPHGYGTLTFTGYKQWMSLAITYDPGTTPALIAGMVALAGLLLSFFVRRRRVFVRAYPGPDGRTVVDVGGLARTDSAGAFETEFDGLARQLAATHQGSEPAVAAPGVPPESGPATGDDDLPALADLTEQE